MSSNSPNVQITAASSIKTRIPSLASIYQAKKSGDNSVEVLKQKFQTDIEHKIHYVQQNNIGTRTTIRNNMSEMEELDSHRRIQTRGLNSSHKRLVKTNSESVYNHSRSNIQMKRHSIASPTQRPPLPPPLPPTMKNRNGSSEDTLLPFITTNNTAKGSETLRKLEREKSFEDARNAVQSQIEKIFQKQNNPKQSDLTNSESPKSPYLNGSSQQMRRHDAVIGMGTPTLPGIFPSKNPSIYTQNKRNMEKMDLNEHENINYRSSLNIRNQPLPPPPPPLPPDIPLHSLDILQKRMIIESSISRDHMRPNMSSLSAKHRSMDSLVTAKITTPDTMDYSSPPISPSRRTSPNSKLRRSRNTDTESHHNMPIYNFQGQHIPSVNPQMISRPMTNEYNPYIHTKNENENMMARRETNKYKQNRRDSKEMRRSISHNSLAMRNSNQNQKLHPLVQQNSVPFKLHPSNAEDMQSRKYHPNPYHQHKSSEKHLLEGSKGSRHIMTASYPSDGAGATSTIGPMSMFGDFSIDPLKKDLRMKFSHQELYKGKFSLWLLNI
jgi:hypothetical protein